MRSRTIDLEESWLAELGALFDSPEMLRLRNFLIAEKQTGTPIYPPSAEIFAAFQLCPFSETKLVILGQDPYHGPGQAHGLSFSVKAANLPPPSLQNIYKELQADLACPIPPHGNLSAWARQGVLLLNAVLTVRRGQAGSHAAKGWEFFTDKIISILNLKKTRLVFVLWGKYAQQKTALIDQSKHLVLQSAHPSPLSAHRGFFGSKPFSKINKYLLEHANKPIDWDLTK